MEKQCYRCKQILDASCFYKHKGRKDGLSTYCKPCQSEKNKEWYSENSEENKEKSNEWYRKNFDRYQIRHKKWADENREEISRKNKIWYAENIDHVKAYNKAHPPKRNKKKHQEARRKWKAANPDKVKAHGRRARQKEMSTPEGRLNHRMRHLMWRALRGTKQGRSWLTFVPYSLGQLKRHIEKQFTEGMSWEVFLRGEIHIDHIIPLSAFTFSSPDDLQFQICWALKNLRPMWAAENIKKSNKLIEPFQQFLL